MTQIFCKRLILLSLVSLNISLSLSAQVLGQILGKSPKKSAIAPQVNALPSSNLNLPNISIVPELNLQDRSGSNLNPSVSEPNSRTNPKPNVAINSEKIDVILENRTSGCRAIANQTINLQPNLCPKPIVRTNNPLIAKANLNALNNSDKQMLYPLSVPTAITSGFGWRVHPITGKSTFHQGVDLGAAAGTPVFAAYSGTIEVADWLGGLGKAVVISHGYSETRYGHLSQILVQQGQWVKQGTVIGLVGSTGMSTGAHLHFELWQRNAGEWAVLDGTNMLLTAMDNLSRYLQSMAGR